MKYYIYTDGAYNHPEKKASASFLIFTDNTYVTANYEKIVGVKAPSEAETVAVGLASAYALQFIDLKKGDEVEFFIDCASTISFVNRLVFENPNDKRISASKQIVGSIFAIRALKDKVTIKLSKVRAHKGEVNPNNYVDKLAKLGIRK